MSFENPLAPAKVLTPQKEAEYIARLAERIDFLSMRIAGMPELARLKGGRSHAELSALQWAVPNLELHVSDREMRSRCERLGELCRKSILSGLEWAEADFQNIGPGAAGGYVTRVEVMKEFARQWGALER